MWFQLMANAPVIYNHYPLTTRVGVQAQCLAVRIFHMEWQDRAPWSILVSFYPRMQFSLPGSEMGSRCYCGNLNCVYIVESQQKLYKAYASFWPK